MRLWRSTLHTLSPLSMTQGGQADQPALWSTLTRFCPVTFVFDWKTLPSLAAVTRAMTLTSVRVIELCGDKGDDSNIGTGDRDVWRQGR